MLGSAPLAKDMQADLKVEKKGDAYVIAGTPAQWCLRFNDEVFCLRTRDQHIPVYVLGDVPDPTKQENVAPPDIHLVSASNSETLDAELEHQDGAVHFRAFVSLRNTPEPSELGVVAAEGSGSIQAGPVIITVDADLPPNLEWVAITGLDGEAFKQANTVTTAQRLTSRTLKLPMITSDAPRVAPEGAKLFVLATTNDGVRYRLDAIFEAPEPQGDGHRYMRKLRERADNPIVWHDDDEENPTSLQVTWYGVVPGDGGRYALESINLFQERKALKYLSPSQLRPRLAFVLRVAKAGPFTGDLSGPESIVPLTDGFHLQRTILFGESAPADAAKFAVIPHGENDEGYAFQVLAKDNEDDVTVPTGDLERHGDAKVIAVKYLVDGRTLASTFPKPQSIESNRRN